MLVSRPVCRRSTHHASAPVVDRHFMLEDYRLVHIDWNSIFQATVFLDSVYIPTGRNRNIIPTGYIKLCLIEVFRPWIGIRRPIELPVSIQRLPKFTVFRQYFTGTFHILERENISMRLFFVQSQVLRRLPLFTGRCFHRSVTKSPKRQLISHAIKRSTAER